jgi:hypothetical protein
MVGSGEETSEKSFEDGLYAIRPFRSLKVDAIPRVGSLRSAGSVECQNPSK